MSVERSEPGREFLSTGAKLYLEVEDALLEFRRQIYNKCAKVVKLRLAEIGSACQIDWTSGSLKEYRWPRVGQEEYRHVGEQLAVQGLGKLYFCLELYRGRVVALVYLWRENANLADALWSRLEDSPVAGGYRNGSDLRFERPIRENDLPDFEKHLNGAIDDFIAFISRSGGLKKYI